MGEIRSAYRFWSQNLMGRDHVEIVGIEGRIILEWVFRRQMWTRFNWCRIESSGGLL
jgi:hypothetical protein